MRDIPMVYEVPDDLATGIGRIMVRWSHIEWCLSNITYALAGVNEKIGRIIVRDFRSHEAPNYFRLLNEVTGKTFKTDIQGLSKDLREAEETRNLMAHGAWGKEPNTGVLLVLLTRGVWDRDTPIAETSRRIKPQGIPHGPEDIAAILAKLDKIIATLTALGLEVGVRPWRGK